jgi:DNA polymerase-4
VSISARNIAHFDLDAFFVSVECLRNSQLKGKPIIIGGSSDRGVVTCCSYEARKFGVHSAMPMRIARRLCPHAILIKGDFEVYSNYSKLVTDIIRDSVPLFEKSSIDEFYIDLSGMGKYFGCNLFATDIKKKVNDESGLPVSFGLASNKLVSKVATNEIKPNGQLEIPFGGEKIFFCASEHHKDPRHWKGDGYALAQDGCGNSEGIK